MVHGESDHRGGRRARLERKKGGASEEAPLVRSVNHRIWRFNFCSNSSTAGTCIRRDAAAETVSTTAPAPTVADRPRAGTRIGAADVRAISTWITVRRGLVHLSISYLRHIGSSVFRSGLLCPGRSRR